MNREQIINATGCVACGANKGEKCKRRGKPRKTVHPIRVQYATGGRELTEYEAIQLRNAPKPKRAPTHSKKRAAANVFYASWDWKKLRYEALKINGNRCQCCGWRPGDTEHGRLVVDHIKPRSKYPSLELEITNLQCLCNDCNMGKSNIYEDDFRGVDSWLSQIGRE
tara:strand:+ start:427 stop:927 length:501 start_codon:yes stop_codon:yes gene_type:complete